MRDLDKKDDRKACSKVQSSQYRPTEGAQFVLKRLTSVLTFLIKVQFPMSFNFRIHLNSSSSSIIVIA